jgi:small subunit ribosomal protein S8
MTTNDPIADMLTRIRNALMVRHESVVIPSSTIKKSIAEILLAEGFINGFKIDENNGKPNIIIDLKYSEKRSVISGLKRISKPGLRVYAGVEELPKVLNGLGIAIVSTNKGLMTDEQARTAKLGGEIIAYVW